MTQDPKKDQAKSEALAVRHVLHLDKAERKQAADRLAYAAWRLIDLTKRLAKTLDEMPNITLPDVREMLAAHEMLADEYLAAEGYDPARCKSAFEGVLANTERNRTLRRLETVASLAGKALTAETEKDRARLMLDMQHELARGERDAAGTLDDAWLARRKLREADRANEHETLQLNPKRGDWADRVNRNLGPRYGMEPGEMFVLGGAPEGGKTSLAALFAVDALAAGCPVLFWQLELGRADTLEHLMAQSLDAAKTGQRHWETPFNWKLKSCNLPAEWNGLLDVPAWPRTNQESLEAGMMANAQKAAREGKHTVQGLVVVDYAQLLTMDDRSPKDANHDVLATAVSRLAHAAAETGACVLLLSQFNKQDQAEGGQKTTALAGADIARMAHRVAFVQKAQADGKACGSGNQPYTEAGKGERRLLHFKKRRGTFTEPPKYETPNADCLLWYNNASRAFHGGADLVDGEEWGTP